METTAKRKNYFFTGLITILPLGLSVYIIYAVFGLIARFTSPFFKKVFILAEISYSPFIVNAISIIITFAFIWVLGVVVTNIIGKQIFAQIERLLAHIPIMKGLYTSIKQLLIHLFSDKSAFKDVVLLQFPRAGVYSIGFVTSYNKGQIQEITQKNLISVFVPTAPNPTTGFLIFIPQEEVHHLSLSTDDALKLIISGGIVNPYEKSVDQL